MSTWNSDSPQMTWVAGMPACHWNEDGGTREGMSSGLPAENQIAIFPGSEAFS